MSTATLTPTGKSPVNLNTVTVRGLSLLNEAQIDKLAADLDVVNLSAMVLSILEPGQLLELATDTAAQGIKAKALTLDINDDDIDEGRLDYTIKGDDKFVMIIAEEMAARGQLDFEKEPKFHLVGAFITAAQMVADSIDSAKAKPILEKGEKLIDMELGSKDRAVATKEFLEELFVFLGANIPAATDIN